MIACSPEPGGMLHFWLFQVLSGSKTAYDPESLEGGKEKRISVNALFTCVTLLFCDSGCVIVDLLFIIDYCWLKESFWHFDPWKSTASVPDTSKSAQNTKLDNHSLISTARQPKTVLGGRLSFCLFTHGLQESWGPLLNEIRNEGSFF